MSTPAESQSARERVWIYIGVGVVLGGVLLLGLLSFGAAAHRKQAEEKADQLVAALQDQGMRAPDTDQIIRVLGTDGGATCEDPNGALGRAVLDRQLGNGAAGPGSRPVITDRRLLTGQLEIIRVYCPDELADFQQYVDELKSDDVAS